MIPVHEQPEPPRFDLEVRKKGEAWLKDHAGHTGRPRNYWRDALPDLQDAYDHLCAYSAVRGRHTVDHFVSVDEDTHFAKVYEWSNYRLADQWVNSSKKDLSSAQLLDPFDVQPGWFELMLPSLQLKVTDDCPAHLRAKANFTITRLKLRDGEASLRFRNAYWMAYIQGRKSLDQVREMLPMLAEAIEQNPAIVAKKVQEWRARVA